MIEARAFVTEIESVRRELEADIAEFKGFYKIHDTVFRNSVTNAPLSKEFLRLRYIPENIWDEKAVILAIKKTLPRLTGKVSDIPTKIEFDSVSEARNYYRLNLQGVYSEDFDFWRDGWQYHLSDGDVVDLEIIEEVYPSIEFKSETDEGIQSLISKFNISKDQIIKGPSVEVIRNLIQDSHHKSNTF